MSSPLEQELLGEDPIKGKEPEKAKVNSDQILGLLNSSPGIVRGSNSQNGLKQFNSSYSSVLTIDKGLLQLENEFIFNYASEGGQNRIGSTKPLSITEYVGVPIYTAKLGLQSNPIPRSKPFNINEDVTSGETMIYVATVVQGQPTESRKGLMLNKHYQRKFEQTNIFVTHSIKSSKYDSNLSYLIMCYSQLIYAHGLYNTLGYSKLESNTDIYDTVPIFVELLENISGRNEQIKNANIKGSTYYAMDYNINSALEVFLLATQANQITATLNGIYPNSTINKQEIVARNCTIFTNDKKLAIKLWSAMGKDYFKDIKNVLSVGQTLCDLMPLGKFLEAVESCLFTIHIEDTLLHKKGVERFSIPYELDPHISFYQYSDGENNNILNINTLISSDYVSKCITSSLLYYSTIVIHFTNYFQSITEQHMSGFRTLTIGSFKTLLNNFSQGMQSDNYFENLYTSFGKGSNIYVKSLMEAPVNNLLINEVSLSFDSNLNCYSMKPPIPITWFSYISPINGSYTNSLSELLNGGITVELFKKGDQYVYRNRLVKEWFLNFCTTRLLNNSSPNTNKVHKMSLQIEEESDDINETMRLYEVDQAYKVNMKYVCTHYMSDRVNGDLVDDVFENKSNKIRDIFKYEETYKDEIEQDKETAQEDETTDNVVEEPKINIDDSTEHSTVGINEEKQQDVKTEQQVKYTEQAKNVEQKTESEEIPVRDIKNMPRYVYKQPVVVQEVKKKEETKKQLFEEKVGFTMHATVKPDGTLKERPTYIRKPEIMPPESEESKFRTLVAKEHSIRLTESLRTKTKRTNFSQNGIVTYTEVKHIMTKQPEKINCGFAEIYTRRDSSDEYRQFSSGNEINNAVGEVTDLLNISRNNATIVFCEFKHETENATQPTKIKVLCLYGTSNMPTTAFLVINLICDSDYIKLRYWKIIRATMNKMNFKLFMSVQEHESFKRHIYENRKDIDGSYAAEMLFKEIQGVVVGSIKFNEVLYKIYTLKIVDKRKEEKQTKGFSSK